MTDFCKAVSEDNFCAVSRLRPIAQTPAVFVCYGNYASEGTT